MHHVLKFSRLRFKLNIIQPDKSEVATDTELKKFVT